MADHIEFKLGLAGEKWVSVRLGLRDKHQIASTKSQINLNEQNSKRVRQGFRESRQNCLDH